MIDLTEMLDSHKTLQLKPDNLLYQTIKHAIKGDMTFNSRAKNQH